MLSLVFNINTAGLDRMGEKLLSTLAPVVLQAATTAEEDARQSILDGPKTGRMYGAHQASAPGEAPASWTGALADSVQAEMTGELEAEVTAGTDYAEYLELGTIKMAPRPFLAPAVDKVAAAFEADVAEVVNKAVEAAAR